MTFEESLCYAYWVPVLIEDEQKGLIEANINGLTVICEFKQIKSRCDELGLKIRFFAGG